LAKIIQ